MDVFSGGRKNRFELIEEAVRDRFCWTRNSILLFVRLAFSSYEGLSNQIKVGMDEALKRASSIHCDELVSIHKSAISNYVGSLGSEKLHLFDEALKIAVGVS